MLEHVISGLTKRRAELAGEAETLHERLAQIATDVGHLDAVIHQFDPDYALGSIRPKHHRTQDAAGRGEISRFILQTVREAPEPITTKDVVRRLMAERGQDVDDRRLVHLTTKRIGMAFSKQKANGLVRAIKSPGLLTLWEVAP